MIRRPASLVALVTAVSLASATAALAYWTAASNGSGTATTTTLASGSMTSVTADATVPLKLNLVWAQSGIVGASPVVPATGYQILRYTVATGGTGIFACGSSATVFVAGTSCADTLTSATTVWYSVTPRYNLTWSGAESSRLPGTPTNLGSPAAFVVTPAATSQTAGTAFTVTIQARRTAGNDTTYTGAHSITITGPGISAGGIAPTLPSTATFNASGLATISVTLARAETTSLTVRDGTAARDGVSASIVVAAGTATRFAWSSPTSSGGTLSGTCYFTCTYTAVGGNGTTFASKVVLTDVLGNPRAAAALTTVTVAKDFGTLTGSGVVTIPAGQAISSGGGNGGAGQLTFVSRNGNWTTDSLSMTSSPAFTGATASFTK